MSRFCNIKNYLDLAACSDAILQLAAEKVNIKFDHRHVANHVFIGYLSSHGRSNFMYVILSKFVGVQRSEEGLSLQQVEYKSLIVIVHALC